MTDWWEQIRVPHCPRTIHSLALNPRPGVVVDGVDFVVIDAESPLWVSLYGSSLIVGSLQDFGAWIANNLAVAYRPKGVP